jgi:hypothetical protein
MTSRPAVAAFLAVMTFGAVGCQWFGKKSKVAPTPPPPAPAPVTAAPPAPEPQPPPPQTAPATPAPQSQAPAPPVHPPKPKPVPTQAPSPQAPAPQQSPPPPAFGQIIDPQQQAEFRRAYQESAKAARQALGQLSGRALSRDQADTANRIRSFLSRADEAQAKDPSTAAQLARRAELLARDLLNSLR